MKSKLSKHIPIGLTFLVFVWTLLLISGCGNSVCIAGFGQCDAPEKPTTTTQPTTTLKITSDKASVAINGTATLTISGGVSPYTLQFEGVGLGALSGSPGVASLATSYTYTAPASTGTVTFKVTDNASNTAFVSVVITSSR